MSDRIYDEFQTAFWATKRAMTGAAEAAFNRHGVRAGQQFILQCLWDEDGLTPGEVARRLELATPTVTRAATRMEAAGLLTRRPHPTDGRLVRLCLTARGHELQQVIDEEMRRLSERALVTLSPEERVQVVRFLNEIRRNVADSPKSRSPGRRPRLPLILEDGVPATLPASSCQPHLSDDHEAGRPARLTTDG